MDDRELLERAAKAAGINLEWHRNKRTQRDDPHRGTANSIEPWNPLTDDGDALRLMAKLHMELYYTSAYVVVRAAIKLNPDELPFEMFDGDSVDDLYTATRRAIVRAAAEIGRTS